MSALFPPSCLHLAVLMALAGPALAAPAPRPDPAPCLGTADPAARLACYDRLHGRPAEGAQGPGLMPALVPAPQPGSPAPAEPERPGLWDAVGTGAVLDARWDLDGQRAGELFRPRPYKPVYLLPVTWTDRLNSQPSSPTPERSVLDPLNLRPVEAKYQLSFKAKLWEQPLGTPGTLWGAYTQSSRWQVYNGARSRPFRETNYEPELIYALPLALELPGLGGRLRQATLSLNHQSNGRSLPFSRSWNRVIAGLQWEREVWHAELYGHWRLPERARDDDNPDIEDHVGRAELLLTRVWEEHVLALQLRHSLRGGGHNRGSAQLEWFIPIEGSLKGYVQVFSGHGESLIDYNLRQTKLGVGFAMVGWR